MPPRLWRVIAVTATAILPLLSWSRALQAAKTIYLKFFDFNTGDMRRAKCQHAIDIYRSMQYRHIFDFDCL